MNCKDCKYFREKVCSVPLWVGGEQYRGKYAEPDDKACGMFEEGEKDAVSG